MQHERLCLIPSSDAAEARDPNTSSSAAMSTSRPLFDTIEPDETEYEERTSAHGNIASAAPVASQGARPATQMASTPGDAESGASRCWIQKYSWRNKSCLYLLYVGIAGILRQVGLHVLHWFER